MADGLESVLGEFLVEHGKKEKPGAKESVILLHGTASNPESNWFPWLRKRLETRKVKVQVPKLPTPAGQSLKMWLREFDAQVPVIGEKTILVGHSMGAGFALRLLERCNEAIKACFLVSAWEGKLNNPAFDPLIESFFREPFNYEAMKKNSGKLKMYHGDNDPYVPLKMAQELSEKLASPLQVVPNGGPLNAEAGYLSFSSLLEDILEVTSD